MQENLIDTPSIARSVPNRERSFPRSARIARNFHRTFSLNQILGARVIIHRARVSKRFIPARLRPFSLTYKRRLHLIRWNRSVADDEFSERRRPRPLHSSHRSDRLDKKDIAQLLTVPHSAFRLVNDPLMAHRSDRRVNCYLDAR